MPTRLLRRAIRKALQKLIFSTLRHPDAREEIFALIRESSEVGFANAFPCSTKGAQSRSAERESATPPPIFVTGRFRSGSTLLWNLFRDIAGLTAYYEPLNERRWFDPRARGEHTDRSHLAVEDYWREYEGLESLCSVFPSRLNEVAISLADDAIAAELYAYIARLIAFAPKRALLQFNRMDFRLGWLAANFPSGKLVHLVRNPRDQWISILHGDNFTTSNQHLSSFKEVDHFYLLRWGKELALTLPFLREQEIEHPYQLHYYIWRLSLAEAERHSHRILSFEELVRTPEKVLPELTEWCDVEIADWENLYQKIKPVSIGKSAEYADSSWFKRHEERCDRRLREHFQRPVSGVYR
ncbi:sulfotransferase [Roseiconus lacunae]|uniref:sulfotransferase n=1 Tax=Roseiconus lacunae TaxID=2605694 RepID=UPI001E4EA0F1|nr:sulfotransferase [Roseiconus lacunae]MCD0458887.1 sulfotransferase [Roseiconus lacunae]